MQEQYEYKFVNNLLFSHITFRLKYWDYNQSCDI